MDNHDGGVERFGILGAGQEGGDSRNASKDGRLCVTVASACAKLPTSQACNDRIVSI